MSELQFTTPDPVRLEIRIASGEIAIETVDGDQSTVAIDGSDKAIEATDVECTGDRLSISEHRKGVLGSLFQSDSVRLSVWIPHRSSVVVATASADARLDGAFYELDYKSASGDLELTGECSGDARIKTASGDVRLPHVGGRVNAQSVSGDIEADSVGGSLVARSVSGDVLIRSIRDGDVRVNSVSGDVALGIAGGTSVDVDANSTTGDVSSDVPLYSEPGGGGGPTVVIRGQTVSGDFHLFRAA